MITNLISIPASLAAVTPLGIKNLPIPFAVPVTGAVATQATLFHLPLAVLLSPAFQDFLVPAMLYHQILD